MVATPSTTHARQDPQRFLNREVSWLAFNRRILEEVANKRHPLFERVNFLAISASNLEEFLVVHIASVEAKYRTDAAAMATVRAEITDILNHHRQLWQDLIKELSDAGIIITHPESLKAEDRAWLATMFQSSLFPVLTPLAIDKAQPFPFISNGSVALALQLYDKRQRNILKVILPLPTSLDRFIRLPPREGDATIRFVMLEDVVLFHLHDIFPLLEARESSTFRVLRDSEIHLAGIVADDFVNTFEHAVKKRSNGAIVRLSMAQTMSPEMRNFLIDQMDVAPEKTVIRDGFMRLSDIKQLIVKDRPELRYKPFASRFPERIREMDSDCFKAIAHKDILVHHPYESFDVVLQFVRQAASDPDVVAIKQTLYRTSSTSPIVTALIAAAQAGKSVTAMVEVKARFDEEANIRWSRDLHKAGAQVVYSSMNIKTHAKMTLVVRRENNALRSYVHFGTGNYHPDTAKVYTDLSLFTCDPDLCQDAAAIFNYMTGNAQPVDLRKIRIAPLQLRSSLMDMIGDEITHARAGKPAQIWAKLNALIDPAIIDKLYEASQAGVQIELIVRGSCCLRPGVPGLSENIRVKSIVGRFLEHSRLAAFANGQDLPHAGAKVFLSSADWMTRNFDRRIETLVPIQNPTVHQQIVSQVFPALLMDTRHSWDLMPDGRYVRADTTRQDFSAHDYFMKNPSLSGRGTGLDKKTLPPHLHYKSVRTSGQIQHEKK